MLAFPKNSSTWLSNLHSTSPEDHISKKGIDLKVLYSLLFADFEQKETSAFLQ